MILVLILQMTMAAVADCGNLEDEAEAGFVCSSMAIGAGRAVRLHGLCPGTEKRVPFSVRYDGRRLRIQEPEEVCPR